MNYNRLDKALLLMCLLLLLCTKQQMKFNHINSVTGAYNNQWILGASTVSIMMMGMTDQSLNLLADLLLYVVAFWNLSIYFVRSLSLSIGVLVWH